MIENVHATGAILTNSVTGLPGFEVEDVTLSNIRIESEEAGKLEWVDARGAGAAEISIRKRACSAGCPRMDSTAGT